MAAKSFSPISRMRFSRAGSGGRNGETGIGLVWLRTVSPRRRDWQGAGGRRGRVKSRLITRVSPCPGDVRARASRGRTSVILLRLFGAGRVLSMNDEPPVQTPPSRLLPPAD